MCCVGPNPPVDDDHLLNQSVPSFSEAQGNAVVTWNDFWTKGAMVDIAGATTDRRALELERRTSDDTAPVAVAESSTLRRYHAHSLLALCC